MVADAIAGPRAARTTRRRRRAVRLLGLILVAYGVVGALILAASAVGLAGPFDQVGKLALTLEGQRQSLVRALDTTTTTLRDAASGIGRLDTSLSRARDSTTQAAALAREVSGTMSQLGASMNITIFGAQPFVGLVGSFDLVAGQLNELSTSIDGIATSLGANSTDIIITRANIDSLRDQVEEVADTLREGPRIEVSQATIGNARLVLYALLGWLALAALAVAMLGLALIARSRGSRVTS